MGRTPSWNVATLPSLVAVDTVVVEIKWFSFVHDLARPLDQRVE